MRKKRSSERTDQSYIFEARKKIKTANSCQVLIFKTEKRDDKRIKLFFLPFNMKKIEPKKTVIKKKLNAKNVREWAKVAKSDDTGK